MSVTTIFFNGRLISVPGSYSEVDASGLESVGLGASGIVAVLGTAEGGKPANAMSEASEFVRFSNPDKAGKYFRSGDLLEINNMLFKPSVSDEIPGGAQTYIPMKVNPATQSTASLVNDNGPAIDLTSRDYGAFTEQLNAAIQSGTNKGKLVTLRFEEITEAADDIGGDVMFTLEYTNPDEDGVSGWAETDARVVAGGAIQVDGRRAENGKDTEFTGTQLAAGTKVEIVSDDGGDIGNAVTIWGIVSGAARKEVLSTNGTTAVESTNTYTRILGITSEAPGEITLRITGAGATITTIDEDEKQGFVDALAMYVANDEVGLVADDATTAQVAIEGKNASGATVYELVTLSGTTPVETSGKFTEITRVFLGLVEAAIEVQVMAVAAKASPTVQTNLQKAADYFNARHVPDVGGFTMTLDVGLPTFLLKNLDVSNDVSNINGVEASYYADNYAVVSWINNNSAYVSAAASDGASGGAPNNTTTPVFLTGGGEGTTLFSHWQAALNLLKKTRVNSVVVLSADPAVHAALEAHCAYMCGIGRSERDGFVGLMNADQSGLATKAQIRQQIIDINSRHIRAYAQSIERFDTQGVRREFGPMFLAGIAAGAQAGAPVGEPLTFKYMNVLSFKQHSSWNPTDDADEMINLGLSFLEQVDGIGRRIVRNVTTYLQGTNLAFTEGSVNQAVNFAVFNFRNSMEAAVGKRGFAGTVNAAKGVAIGALGLLTDSTVLTAWRALNIELVLDVLEVSVEIAPVLPINFVKSTLHLVTIRQSAAA